MRRTYRYRLDPTRRQVAALEAQLEQERNLYNAALEHRQRMWRDHGVSIRCSNQSAELRELRSAGMIDAEANCWSQQQVLKRLDRAFEAFFRRVKNGEKPGYPRFKARQRFNASTWTFAGKAGGVGLVDGRLRLQGVGHVKVRWHRAIPAESKLCTVHVVRKGKHWYAFFSLDNVSARPLSKTGQEVGIDLGITTFAALSTGELITGPRADRTGAKAARKAARKVSRRKRGSNRRRKAVVLLARQREREANRRRDHAHKTARDLVERFDVIAVEDLHYRGLAKGMLARDCNDQGWAGFIGLLDEKAECAARQVIRVDPKNTSQTCSACGVIVPKTLGVREHHCACGYSADRDVNAARNVLIKSTPARMGPSGVNDGEKKPVSLSEKPSPWHITTPRPRVPPC